MKTIEAGTSDLTETFPNLTIRQQGILEINRRDKMVAARRDESTCATGCAERCNNASLAYLAGEASRDDLQAAFDAAAACDEAAWCDGCQSAYPIAETILDTTEEVE